MRDGQLFIHPQCRLGSETPGLSWFPSSLKKQTCSNILTCLKCGGSDWTVHVKCGILVQAQRQTHRWFRCEYPAPTCPSTPWPRWTALTFVLMPGLCCSSGTSVPLTWIVRQSGASVQQSTRPSSVMPYQTRPSVGDLQLDRARPRMSFS